MAGFHAYKAGPPLCVTLRSHLVDQALHRLDKEARPDSHWLCQCRLSGRSNYVPSIGLSQVFFQVRGLGLSSVQLLVSHVAIELRSQHFGLTYARPPQGAEQRVKVLCQKFGHNLRISLTKVATAAE